jgi:hypothetical protein
MTLETLEHGDTIQAHASLTPDEVTATIPMLEQIVDSQTEDTNSFERVEGESLLGVLQSFEYAEKAKPLELETDDAEKIAQLAIGALTNLFCPQNSYPVDDQHPRAA